MPRDYVDTVMCRNGHKWDQCITADENGQDSVTYEEEEYCPECGMCTTECFGCELCQPEPVEDEQPAEVVAA